MNDVSRYIAYEDLEFPSLLKHISDAPQGIFVRGELPGDELVKVAILGARACSEYGISAAKMLARDLARSGVIIVSGMARGIDAAAHQAAIEEGGKTIAVLGCGVDICYPPEHDDLMGQIIRNGCVISEYAMGTKPERYYFPARNRIISGLCKGIIIVEAAEKSGTSVTANHALDQGREVFAVPGNIFSKLSRGVNDMIKQGAIAVTCANDVLYELKSDCWHNTIDEKPIVENEKIKTLAPNEKLVYDCVAFGKAEGDGLHIDDVISKCGISAAEAQYIFVKLELDGLVKRLAGNRMIVY